MDMELASYFGLIGSGLALLALFMLTAMGILFVRLLDAIEGWCARVALRWSETKAIVPR
jgi:hypothetical protein